MKRFQDKVVLITGATDGVGYQVAKQFAQEGAKLALIDNYQNISAMQLSSKDHFISDRSLLISMEGGKDSEIAVCIDDVVQYFGTIDILVYASPNDCMVGPIEELEENELDKLYFHLKDIVFLIKQVIPIMQRNGCGSIVAYGTVAGLMGLPMLSSHVMLQHAMLGLVKTAALENSQSNIRVNAVISAPIETSAMDRLESKLNPGMEKQVRQDFCRYIPMKRYGTTAEVANTILFLASEEAKYTTGSVYNVDGGMSATR
ncbi:SDR family oxidoreductase [Shimazuella sp. AN120528]|uniref:SDR family NAD(P)-dependent oxidoreductase n=1 Tax=Shimazuella soli TaxID=1892854 RepID=UPI001F11517C|nr:SDR family oxidoreductase [Shimazuella soli]